MKISGTVRNLQMHGIPSSSLQVCAIAHAYRTNYLCVNYKRFHNKQRDNLLILFCQPRVEVTSCFVYKVMGLTFHERINTQLIYKIEIAQVVARRITKPQRTFLGSNLTGCSFFVHFFYYFFWRGGGGG